MHVKRIYILLLLDGMLYKYQLSSTVLLSFNACVSFLLLYLAELHIDISVLKSPLLLSLSFSPFMSVNICLIY